MPATPPAVRALLAGLTGGQVDTLTGLTDLTVADILAAATPPVPPVRQLYDPDHVIDHNTIREALLWLVAKAQEPLPPPGPSTWG